MIRTIHRTSGPLLLLFVAAHLGNHLAALWGVEMHGAVMRALRTIYRHPLVEPLLLLAVVVQVTTGLIQVTRGWRTRSGRVAWLQASSGLAIVTFLSIHVSAVLVGRASGLDTGFHFAAAGMHAGLAGFFIPYYFIAVAALFAHLGCAAYWWLTGRGREAAAGRALGAMIVTGVLVASLLVTLLAGGIVPVAIPPAYLASFTG